MVIHLAPENWIASLPWARVPAPAWMIPPFSASSQKIWSARKNCCRGGNGRLGGVEPLGRTSPMSPFGTPTQYPGPQPSTNYPKPPSKEKPQPQPHPPTPPSEKASSEQFPPKKGMRHILQPALGATFNAESPSCFGRSRYGFGPANEQR